MNNKAILSKAGYAFKKAVHCKAYHLTHDWTGICCIGVTFLDMHGLGQIVIGVGLILTVIDYLIGEDIKIGP